MVHHYFGCGMCDQCRSGWIQLCREGAKAMGATAPGAHADLVTVPFNSVLPKPEGLSYLAAAAISCGTGTAWGALKRLQLHGDDTIAIFGQGPVGLAATQLASAMGARVIALDISPSRLDRCRDFGAWDTVNPAQVDSVADAVRDLNGGRGVSKSLETSGASSAAAAALHVLDLWGVACWVGRRLHDPLRSHRTPVQAGHRRDLVDHVDTGDGGLRTLRGPAGIDVDALFTDRWKLADAVEAYELLDKQTSGKGVFVP